MSILRMLAVLIVSCVLIFAIELTDNKSLIEVEDKFVELSYEGVLLVTGDWTPYTNKNHDGIIDQIVKLILEEVSIDYTIRVYPWERAYKMVETGNAMGSYAWATTLKREGKTYFSDTVFFEIEDFFYMDDKYDDMTPEEILNDKNTVVGMMQAYHHTELLDPVNLDFSTSEKNSIDKLINERVDGVMLDFQNGKALIEEYYPEYKNKIRSKTGFLPPIELRVLINNKIESGFAFSEEFNAAFDRVKKNGVYYDFLEKHGVENEK